MNGSLRIETIPKQLGQFSAALLDVATLGHATAQDLIRPMSRYAVRSVSKTLVSIFSTSWLPVANSEQARKSTCDPCVDGPEIYEHRALYSEHSIRVWELLAGEKNSGQKRNQREQQRKWQKQFE